MKAKQLDAIHSIYHSIQDEIGRVYDTVPVSSEAYGYYCACIYRAYLIYDSAMKNQILFLEAVVQLAAIHNDFESFQRHKDEQ